MVISIDAEKAFDKIQHPFMIKKKKTFNKVCIEEIYLNTVVVVQSLSHVWLFATPWTAAQQASWSITISLSFLKLTSTESVMPSNHLFLCYSHLLLPSIFPSIRVFSSESALYIRWPKYWSFSFSISPSSEYSGSISFRIDWFDLSRVFSNTTVQKHQFFSLLYGPALTSIHALVHGKIVFR